MGLLKIIYPKYCIQAQEFKVAASNLWESICWFRNTSVLGDFMKKIALLGCLHSEYSDKS